jgi:hypothetical protein
MTVWTVLPRIERENDGKNGIRRKNLRPGEDGGGGTLAFAAFGLK